MNATLTSVPPRTRNASAYCSVNGVRLTVVFSEGVVVLDDTAETMTETAANGQISYTSTGTVTVTGNRWTFTGPVGGFTMNATVTLD